MLIRKYRNINWPQRYTHSKGPDSATRIFYRYQFSECDHCVRSLGTHHPLDEGPTQRHVIRLFHVGSSVCCHFVSHQSVLHLSCWYIPRIHTFTLQSGLSSAGERFYGWKDLHHDLWNCQQLLFVLQLLSCKCLWWKAVWNVRSKASFFRSCNGLF